MATDRHASDAREVWQHQRTEAVPVDIEDVRSRALAFQGQMSRRNRGEYVAAALAAALFGLFFWTSDGPWTRTGALLAIGGLLYVALQLRQRGSTRSMLPGASAIAFHRAELQRQRDALRKVWRWYLAPLVPGLIVFGVGSEVDEPPIAWAPLSVYLVLGLAVFAAISELNHWAARLMQRELDELAELERDD